MNPVSISSFKSSVNGCGKQKFLSVESLQELITESANFVTFGVSIFHQASRISH